MDSRPPGLGTTAMLLAIALGFAAHVGCGPDRTVQCKSLVAALERGERARIPADLTSKAERKAYFDQMLVVKKELAALELPDDELAKLGAAATKNLEAVLHCGDGSTLLKRLRCDRDPTTKRIVIFDAQATYLRAWNEAEARRFVASAKLTRR